MACHTRNFTTFYPIAYSIHSHIGLQYFGMEGIGSKRRATSQSIADDRDKESPANLILPFSRRSATGPLAGPASSEPAASSSLSRPILGSVPRTAVVGVNPITEAGPQFQELRSIKLCHADTAPQLRFMRNRLTVVGEKGYRMVRCTHGIQTGMMYYEVRFNVPEALEQSEHTTESKLSSTKFRTFSSSLPSSSCSLSSCSSSTASSCPSTLRLTVCPSPHSEHRSDPSMAGEEGSTPRMADSTPSPMEANTPLHSTSLAISSGRHPRAVSAYGSTMSSSSTLSSTLSSSSSASCSVSLPPSSSPSPPPYSYCMSPHSEISSSSPIGAAEGNNSHIFPSASPDSSLSPISSHPPLSSSPSPSPYPFPAPSHPHPSSSSSSAPTSYSRSNKLSTGQVPLGVNGHIRVGWSTTGGDLQLPTGADEHSYAYGDTKVSTVACPLYGLGIG